MLHALSILIMVKPWWVLEIANKSAGEWRVEDWLLAFILIEYPAKHYLVGGLEQFLCFHMLEIFGNNNSNWLTHNFQRGRSTTNQLFSLAGVSKISNEVHWSVHPGWPDLGVSYPIATSQTSLTYQVQGRVK